MEFFTTIVLSALSLMGAVDTAQNVTAQNITAQNITAQHESRKGASCPCASEYLSFTQKFNRTYSNARCNVFCDNYDQIQQHNARADSTYVATIRFYHDLTNAERRNYFALRGDYKRFTNSSRTKMPHSKHYYKTKLLTTLVPEIHPKIASLVARGFVGDWYIEAKQAQDWWTQNRVVDVRDQGSCGDCWAESATALIESAYFQQTGKLVRLSVQQMAECTPGMEHNDGCNGGWPKDALEYAKTNGGLCTENDYPTMIGDGMDRNCNATLAALCTKPVHIVDIVSIPQDDEEMLFVAAGLDVVSVGIDASGQGWGSYEYGVYNGYFNGQPDCSTTALDHAVVVTGYGIYNHTTPFYIVRNSWGDEKWGEMGGYILMSRGNNTCGIAHDASFVDF